MKEKRSFFERLTGSYKEELEEEAPTKKGARNLLQETEQELEEGQLSVDAYQTSSEIVIQAMVAGARMEDLDVSITQDTIIIKGKRMDARRVDDTDFFERELYWGNFGRTLLLPQEVDPDEAEATMKNGMLTIRVQKLDRERVQKLRIKNE